MTETVNITINPDDGWLDVPGVGTEGYVTVTKSAEFCQKASQPSEEFLGHHLKTMDSFRYTLSGDKLFIKVSEPAVIVLTGGV